MRIGFITDLHGVTRFLRPMLAQSGPLDLLLVGGDITNFGGVQQAARVLDQCRALVPRVLAVHGNLDRPEVLAWLEHQDLSLHGRGKSHQHVGLMGCGASNITPMHTPSELTDQQLHDQLHTGWNQLGAHHTTIMVCHAPPLNTKADRLFTGKHVGSAAVREFVERRRPSLCLTGHVHESAATDVLGESIVVNPGPFLAGRYALVSIEAGHLTCEMRQVDSPRHARVRSQMRVLVGKVVGLIRQRIGPAPTPGP